MTPRQATPPVLVTGVHRMFLMRPPHLGKPKQRMWPLLEAAKSAGVEHVVLLSLQGAEHTKVVPHHALEVWLRESGLSWTFVRAAFFMQNLVGVTCAIHTLARFGRAGGRRGAEETSPRQLGTAVTTRFSW